jgi:hypothetical protein
MQAIAAENAAHGVSLTVLARTEHNRRSDQRAESSPERGRPPALFGHFGDRIDRKATLVALVTMGISTVAIGALPSCRTIGVAATLLLALCRFGRVWGPATDGTATISPERLR